MSEAKSPKSGKISGKNAGVKDSKVAVRASSPSATKTQTAKTQAAKKQAAKTPRSKYTRAEVAAIFEVLKQQNPEPQSDLEFSDPYTLVVAVALSAQATDAGVNKATRRLFAEASTPAAMVALGEERVMELIKTIGLFRNKAKNVIALSKLLLEKHDGMVPRSREALQELPGVGRKTANVVLNVAFGEPTIAVDTHIFRVANRLNLAPGKTPDAVEIALEKVIPKDYLLHAHHWLILHGRYVCKARKPNCGACAIYDLCKSKEKLPREG